VTRPPARRDAGETLVELLMTVVILGLATAGISGALLVSSKASSLQQQSALAQNALRSWAEQVGAAPTYTPCAVAASFGAPVPALPTGLTASVSTVQYWTGTVFTTTCGTDTGIQRVTLRITATNGLSAPLTDTVAVVVRRPCVTAC
jgi:type II secretory pathway pseudopilin PulG